MSVTTKRAFVPSNLQAKFFDELRTGTSSITLIAVAGSGKSTTCIRALPIFKAGTRIKLLSFGARIVKDLKQKVQELEVELGMRFPNVYVSTFHACGSSALRKYLKSKGINQSEPDTRKCRTILKKKLAERWEGELKKAEEEMFLYGKFVCDLVGYAKGSGVGIAGILPNEPEVYEEIIEHHDMMLESKDADLDRAIALARALLVASFKEARDNGWIDFDDMLYMPLALNLEFYKEDVIFCDEAQDTNVVRREIIKRMCHSRTRCIFVGDPKQAIFGFTGATNDAMDVITKEFRCKQMMLNVSYRCPKRIVSKVKSLVPYFEVYEGNIDGDEFTIEFDDLLDIVGDEDAVLCRNVAPMVSLAFKLIGKGRACHVLGSEIGKGLITLVKQMDAHNIDHLRANIEAWCEREAAAFRLKGKDDRAAAIEDKALCVYVLCDNLSEGMRTVEGLITKIENLFKDEDRTLCLSSIHKAKGREWRNVVIYCPERMPSPWARKDWMVEQELNLEYVAYTRAMNWTMYLPEVK